MANPSPAFTPPNIQSQIHSAPAALAPFVADFTQATDRASRERALVGLVRGLRSQDRRHADYSALRSLIEFLEADDAARRDFSRAWGQVVEEHRSVKALAESGIPSDHSLPMEFFGRLIAKFLPESDDASGATFLLAILFSSDRDLRRLRDMPQDLFDRLIEVLTPPNSAELWEHQLYDIREALRLEAARVGGLGLRPEMRSRDLSTGISNSPFYEL